MDDSLTFIKTSDNQ